MQLQRSTCFLADEQAGKIYGKLQGRSGLFPCWIPGIWAALYHNEKQVSKGIAAYIRDAKHMPDMQNYLIWRSKEATRREKPWDSKTYKTIDWKHYGKSFQKLSMGQKIQISKYTNDLLPTACQIQTLDNQTDG
jgi:hypothetical protein